MASIVAYIELREGIVTLPTRFLLAEARRVADLAGATVYALLALGPLDHQRIDQLAEEVSAAGADRVLCSAADRLAGPPIDATHGALLSMVADHLRPILFLFPAGGVGVELGPPLAVRIGAGYVADAHIEVRTEKSDLAPASQRVVLTRWRTARDARRKIDVGDFERPVVAGLASGRVTRPLGEPRADVEMLPCPEPRFPGLRLVASVAVADSAVELCSTLVVASAKADDSALVELASNLPTGTALVTTPSEDHAALQMARPSDVLLVSPVEKPDDVPLPAPAPGCSVSVVGFQSGSSGASKKPEAALSALANALRRARNRAEGAT